jgi:hypothetical protein
LKALAVTIAAVCLLGASTANAQDLCLTADPPAASAPAQRLRFGITPQLAGTVGGTQGEVAPEDPGARDRALKRLRPPHRELVVRLNRLFMSDGDAAIALFAHRVRRYARRGYEVEAQVRYHPSSEQEGDMAAWTRFVRRATRSLAQSPGLVALSITNEVNLPVSANTSDGAYDGATEAIVAGITAAARTLRRIDRRDVALGFTYAYRYLPDADAAFWTELGRLATPRFRHALDYVGVQLYPGLFWPPALLTQSAGEATLEALTLVRGCFMPQAGLGADTGLWISELGFATNLGHSEQRQAGELDETVRAVHALSGTLGVTDLRYFNLRDNRPDGGDLFDDVGLLRADYTAKPAFATYRSLIFDLGTRRRSTIPRR